MANLIPDHVDLLVVGGGINGAGIARDAAGRGLSVLLVEQDDLASATSSASSKLIHGGLRYLEHYEFRLVREALAEREVLLRAAPHIVHPMQFIMPHVPALRPAWMIRAGLLFYDYLARRQTLPGSFAIDLRQSRYGAGLKTGLTRAFVYSDCQVDDARLVLLTARAAADLGAVIATRTTCRTAYRDGASWRVELEDKAGKCSRISAAAMVNATGPWARQFLVEAVRCPSPFNLKLVKGSHIVVPRLYEGNHAFILQNDDRRVIFVYTYEDDHTLIGTTDVEFKGRPGHCSASEAEIAYLLRAVSRYFAREMTHDDVVWSYCGIRPLIDDGSVNPSEVTRDYVLHVDGRKGEAPVLSVFGGKITTYRHLAEHALEKLAAWFPRMGPAWTRSAALPGGNLAAGPDAYARELERRYAALPGALLRSLVRRHGSLCPRILDGVHGIGDLGRDFGAGLYAREISYLIDHEWARTADDVLWRRTKAGLRLTPEQAQSVGHFVTQYTAGAVR